MSACSSGGTRPAAPTSAPTVTGTVDADERMPETTEAPAGDNEPDSPQPTLPTIPPVALNDLANVDGSIVLRDDDGSLVVVRPDGNDRQELASGAESLLNQPTFSRNGDRVAWTAIDTDGPRFFVADVDGSNVVSAAVSSPAFYLSWSPDDTWIAALRPVPASIEFVVADPESAEVRAVATGQPFYFDWLDDDSIIAAVGTTTLTVIDASGEVPPTPRVLASPLGAFQTPAVVAGGDEGADDVVVAVLQNGFNDVVLLGADGSQDAIGRSSGPVATTNNPTEGQVAVLVIDVEPPQSQVIGFQTDEPPDLPSGQVSIIDLDTREVTTRDERQIVAMQWSPDGSSLAMLQAGNNTLQWLVATPDGVSMLTPFIPSQEFATSYLPFADQYNHSSSWWSPDSRAMVLSGSIDGQTGVWVDLVDDEFGAVRISGGDLGLWSAR
ncbi:MAG: hypothetical protein R8J94_11140 [Acidimicrobiia bacterium]|nr:hypothetical protein [Acidimicrobiia bacterium]